MAFSPSRLKRLLRGDYNHWQKLPKKARAFMRQRGWRYDGIDRNNYKRVEAFQHADGQWSPPTYYYQGDREWQKDVRDAINSV